MKKTFRSILAGALSLLAVSCYDDSLVLDEIDDIKGRLTAIENTLNAEVGGVNDLLSRVEALEGKVAAIKVETDANGVTTLTLSDNSTVVLSKNGVLTLTDEGEWATVAANGTVTPLGVSLGHNLTFKVENGVLMYAPAGSTEYVATDVKVSEYTAHVIGNIVPAADGKSVAVTIGGQTISLALAAQSGEITLSRSEMYVAYGLSKTVTLTGAEDFYVAAKPDGWKVTVDGNVLTVSAPSKAAAELGVVENEGQIVVHADADGCAYASMTVKSGDAFSIEVDTATGMVTFFNALSVEYPDLTGMGSPTYGFGDALVGIIPLSDMQYVGSVDILLEMAEYGNIPGGYLANIKSNNLLGKPYEAGKYEEDTFSISISDLGSSFYPAAEIEEGVHYAVWAVPQTDKVLKDLYTVAYYKPVKVVVEGVDTTFNDVTIKPTLLGAVEYYANVFEASMFEEMPMKHFLETGYMGIGPWKQFQQSGNGAAMGTKIESGVEVKLSYLQYDNPLKPATEYVGYVFPIQDGKAPADYVYETDLEPYIFRFTTDPLVEGAPAATLTLSDATDYSSISVSVKVPEGTSAYYKFYNLGAADDMTDAELAVELMSDCYYPATADKVVKESYLSGGDQKELVVATVTADGKYAITREVFATKSYPYSDAITVAVDSVTPNAETGEYTVVFSVTGATKFVAYNYSASSASAFTGNVLKYGATASYSTYKWVDVVDGKATITVKPSSTSYKYLIYSAYNVADNAVSNLLAPASTVLFE